MQFIKLNHDNIDGENLCCAMADKKCRSGVDAKKAMIKGKLNKGYVFNKLNVKGKVFTDYCPVEVSLLPVHAEGYMAINCFWVSGQYAKHGYGKALIEQCIEDCRNNQSQGIVAICGDKKRPFLSDKKFYQRFGFEVCDTAPPYFELLVYKLNPDAPTPQFFTQVKGIPTVDEPGVFIYYSEQCPFTDYYVNVLFKASAEKHGVPFRSQKLTDRDDIQRLPVAHNIHSVFLDGKFISHEIMGPAKIDKLLQAYKK